MNTILKKIKKIKINIKREVGWLNEHSYLDLHVIINMNLVKSINNDINTNKLNIQSYNLKHHPYKIERENSNSACIWIIMKN